MALLPQETLILHDTIRENIGCGRPARATRRSSGRPGPPTRTPSSGPCPTATRLHRSQNNAVVDTGELGLPLSDDDGRPLFRDEVWLPGASTAGGESGRR
ncbi:hypothetical protein STRMOE7_20400 [Streptomyces sp. MOE7]|nr:hypothetical protein STRMOE7_20400 [Streptomyces sp. MOE7]